MLLSLEAKTDPKVGTYLDVWEVGGAHKTLRRPFDPFYYSGYPVAAGYNEEVVRTLLSTRKPTKMWKVSFPAINVLNWNRAPGCMEANIRYDIKVATSMDLKKKAAFPTYDSFDTEFWDNKIKAVSWYGKGVKKCVSYYNYSEKEMLEWFVRTMVAQDPDLPSTYWGSFADWQELLDAAKRQSFKLAVGRDGSVPWIRVYTYESGKRKGEDHYVKVPGRLHFDVWKEAVMDQTLFGIKNLKMKTLGRWFHLDPIIEYFWQDIAGLSQAKLEEYCLNDSRINYSLAGIYLRNIIPLVERLGIPLNLGIERNPSHVGNIMYFREFAAHGIVADRTNVERFPEFAGGYQGALTNLFKAGIFRDIFKIDFKSMYPSTMIVYNYSPENIVRYSIVPVDTMQLFEQPPWVQFKGDEIWVFDKYVGMVKLEMDMSYDSISRELQLEMKNARKEIKASEAAAEVKESQQWGVKTIMNSLYGYHGMKTSKCGAFILVAHICGHGRWMEQMATDDLVRLGSVPIERDTDGIYGKGKSHLDEILEHIKGMIPDRYMKGEIALDEERFAAGIFYDEKGYVLKKDDGKLMFHGSGLKGKHLPRLCDLALERVVNTIFDSPDDVYSELNDIGRGMKRLPESDFIMTVKFNKNPDSYEDSNLYGNLAKKAKAAGISVRWGDEISYVKTPSGYVPSETRAEKEMDYDYYMKRTAAVVNRLLGVTHKTTQKGVLLYLKGAQHLR